jgi:hypothetical protein
VIDSRRRRRRRRRRRYRSVGCVYAIFQFTTDTTTTDTTTTVTAVTVTAVTAAGVIISFIICPVVSVFVEFKQVPRRSRRLWFVADTSRPCSRDTRASRPVKGYKLKV